MSSIDLNWRKFDITKLLVIINVQVYFVMLVSAGWRQCLIFNADTLLDWGANIGAFSVNGQYWRLFSSMFVHASILHLLINMYALLVFGPVVSAIFGWWRFLLIYVLSGLAGALSSIIWNPTQISAGASAALMGIVGGLFAYVVSRGDKDRAAQFAHPFVFLGLICASICGGFFVPEIDNAAHIGGLFGGFVSGLLLLPQAKGDKLRIPIFVPLLALSLISVLAITFTIHAARADKRTDTYRIAARAMKNLKGKKFEDALKDYDELLRLDLNATFFIGRSEALAGLKKYNQAIEDCNRALALEPGDRAALLDRAMNYHRLGNYKKSVDEMSKIIKRLPKFAPAYNSRAWSQLPMGRYESALQDVNKALELSPDSAMFLDTRGMGYFFLNDYHKAMLDYDKALVIDPEQGACYYHKAMIYEKVGEKEKAEKAYAKAKSLDYEPDDWELKLKVEPAAK